MEKNITITQFADELIKRIEDTKDINCCKKEIKRLAAIAKEKIGSESILVDWQEK